MNEASTDTPEDVYAAQRQELMQLLKTCAVDNLPLTAFGNVVLKEDDVPILLQKIRNAHPFSRRERTALTEAGFQVENLFPKMI